MSEARDVIERALREGPIAPCERYGECGELAVTILAALAGAGLAVVPRGDRYTEVGPGDLNIPEGSTVYGYVIECPHCHGAADKPCAHCGGDRTLMCIKTSKVRSLAAGEQP